MKKKEYLFIRTTVNTFECLRESNTEASERYDDDYFLGKAQAYDLAVDNLNNIIRTVKQ
jgi:hypothetical protein